MQPPRETLPRVLGPWAATAIVIGTVIGSGVFLKPRAIASDVPYPGLGAVVWLLGGLLALAGALVYAEVCVLLPRAGGNYVFLREAYGRLAGWLYGWVDFWMIRSGSIAALATAFAISAHDVWTSEALRDAAGWPRVGPVPDWGQRLLVILLIAALAAVNIRGVRWGGGLQVVVTVLKVGTIAAVVVVPLAFLAADAPGPSGDKPTLARLSPLWPESFGFGLLGAMGTALLSVLWPYHGWMNVGPIAGEVEKPQRNLPLALIAGVGTIIVLYLGCNLAYHLMLTPAEIASGANETPTATRAALKLLGSVGTAAMSAVILCSVFGSLNGNLLVGPRVLFAMGEDGLAPRWLRAVHPRWRTPAAAIAVLAAWSSLLVLGAGALAGAGMLEAGKGPFDQLTDFAMFGAVIFETMAVLSIFVFRRTMPDAPRPYRCPWYPWLPLAYAAIPLFILASMALTASKRTEALIGLAFIGAGVLAYHGLGLHRRRPQAPGTNAAHAADQGGSHA